MSNIIRRVPQPLVPVPSRHLAAYPQQGSGQPPYSYPPYSQPPQVQVESGSYYPQGGGGAAEYYPELAYPAEQYPAPLAIAYQQPLTPQQIGSGVGRAGSSSCSSSATTYTGCRTNSDIAQQGLHWSASWTGHCCNWNRDAVAVAWRCSHPLARLFQWTGTGKHDNSAALIQWSSMTAQWSSPDFQLNQLHLLSVH
jgi:hypothetical protein